MSLYRHCDTVAALSSAGACPLLDAEKTLSNIEGYSKSELVLGTQFTCFIGTEVQILTPEELQLRSSAHGRA